LRKARLYEEEWRAIHNVAGTRYRYSPEMLTGTYFGPDIDPQTFKVVCFILAGQNDTILFWKRPLSVTEIRFLFEEIEYTPHLQAKRKGMIG
jgi:hypothetical protein